MCTTLTLFMSLGLRAPCRAGVGWGVGTAGPEHGRPGSRGHGLWHGRMCDAASPCVQSGLWLCPLLCPSPRAPRRTPPMACTQTVSPRLMRT